MRNVKTWGLALLAALSVAAAMAVPASADTLNAQGYPAVLTGEADVETGSFVTTAGIVSCPWPKYDATISSSVSTAGSVSVTPTYPDEGCTGFGFPATVETNGCTFVFRGLFSGTTGGVDLECPFGKEVTITARSAGVLKCTIHVPTQTFIGSASFTNIAGGITAMVSASLIDYTHTQGTGLGSCPSGSGSIGSLSARAIIKAESESGVSTSLWLT
ncbi:MAG TPA: hypothetical protein VFX85_04715 [Solirubrobacterales bacterium]|nr:hypothetical protein [Solirubrobacterales bacterium]